MAKKKASRKKAPKRAKAAAKPRRTKLAKPRAVKKARAAKKRRTSPAPKPTVQIIEYAATFFLTADHDRAPAFEIDGTPHPRTVASYRSENADIREFEEQDGKILYKVKPLKSAAN
jgi:hypothetical protein